MSESADDSTEAFDAQLSDDVKQRVEYAMPIVRTVARNRYVTTRSAINAPQSCTRFRRQFGRLAISALLLSLTQCTETPESESTYSKMDAEGYRTFELVHESVKYKKNKRLKRIFTEQPKWKLRVPNQYIQKVYRIVAKDDENKTMKVWFDFHWPTMKPWSEFKKQIGIRQKPGKYQGSWTWPFLSESEDEFVVRVGLVNYAESFNKPASVRLTALKNRYAPCSWKIYTAKNFRIYMKTNMWRKDRIVCPEQMPSKGNFSRFNYIRNEANSTLFRFNSPNQFSKTVTSLESAKGHLDNWPIDLLIPINKIGLADEIFERVIEFLERHTIRRVKPNEAAK